jgi:hypothetical protein
LRTINLNIFKGENIIFYRQTMKQILTPWSRKFMLTICKNSVPTSKKTQHVSIRKINLLTLLVI